MSRSPWEVSDELWALVEPLLPVPERVFGRPRVSDRAALEGILFVLVTGIPWRALPAAAGVRLGRHLLAALGGLDAGRGLGAAARRAARPSCAAWIASTGRGRAWMAAMCRLKRGSQTGPSPVDRGRLGAKHHLIVDARGLPLAWSATAGNRHDVTQLMPLLDRIPAVGWPRRDAPTPSRDDRRRPRLRLRQVPPPAAPARHPSPHRAGARPSTAPDSAAGAGSSSAPSPGCTPSNDSPPLRTPRRHPRRLGLACCIICSRRLHTDF